MALSWVDNSYWSYAWWKYYYTGSSGVAVRASASTSAQVYYRMSNSSDLNAWVAVDDTSQKTELWIHHNGGSNHDWWGWSATRSGGSTYFTKQEDSQWVSDGYWSGTAWAYYYYPSSGSTSYTRQASSSRTSPSFTIRSSPGSNTVKSSSTTITLTVNYNNGSSNATQNGTKYTQTVYSFAGWDEKTSASAPPSLTAGTVDYSAGASRSSTSDLYYYADYTAGTPTTKYTNNTKSLGTPTKSSTSTTYTVTYAPNGGTVSPTRATTSRTTTYSFSSWTPSTGITVNSSNVATFTATGTVTANYTATNGTVGTVTLPTPSRTNYIFNGWLAPNGTTYAAGTAYRPSSTSETLTAQWTLNQITLTLANSANWTGSYAPTGGGTFTPGASITLVQPLKTGWHFVSWTNASGTVLSYNASYSTTAPNASTTYTANVARNTYKVRYDSNGGNGVMPESSHTYGVSSNLSTNTFTKTGSTFAGWATSANATSADYNDGASVSTLTSTNGGIVILYAVWRAATNVFIYTNNKWTPALKYVYTSVAPAPTPVPEFTTSWPSSNITFTYSNESWSQANNRFTISNIGTATGSLYLWVNLNSPYKDYLTPTIKNSSNTTIVNADATSGLVSIDASDSDIYTVTISGIPTTEISNTIIGTLYISDGEGYSESKNLYSTITLPEAPPTYTNGYTVAAVSGSTYTFVDNGAGYYESNNKGVDSSYALARTTVTTDGTKYVIVEYLCSCEAYYDYGLISTINTTFANSTSQDSNTIISRPGYGDGFALSVKKVSFGKLSAGTHTFDVKFIKDSSSASGADSMVFKVMFVDSVPSVLSSGCSYSSVSGASYGFSLSQGWYYSRNTGIANSAAVGKLTISANGVDHIYIDAYQFSQNSVDFGLLSTRGGTLSTSNTIDTANVLRSYQNATNETRITTDLGVLSMGTHTYYIKYRKDASGNYFDDCIQFRVRTETASATTPSFINDSVTVEPISGSTYTFVLNSNGYYESNNKGVDSSYALAKVTVISRSTKYIVLDCINYAESNFDYGLLSTAGQTLSASNTVDTTNVKQSFQTINKNSIYRVSYGQRSGKMTFYAKFRKDFSASSYNDSLQFKVNFLSSLPAVLNSSYSFASAGGSYQFIRHPFNSTGQDWYIPNNMYKHNTAAISKITINANGIDNVYIDYYQSSEQNYDYGLIGTLNGPALSTTNAVDSSGINVNLKGKTGSGTVDLGVLASGTYTVYIKYIKDSSHSLNQDTCGIHVRFGGTSITGWINLSSYYWVDTVPDASYGFVSTGDSEWPYWSDNKQISNSAALARVYFRCNGFDNIYLDVYCDGESSYDFGLIGTLNGANFSVTNTTDTANVQLSTSGKQRTVYTVNFGLLSAGMYSVCVKYRKDGSVNTGMDSLYIKPRINGSAPSAPVTG